MATVGTLGSKIPDFTLDSTAGKKSLYEVATFAHVALLGSTEITAPSSCYPSSQVFGDNWGILFSHPADFTPICTTELGMAEEYMEDFKKRNVSIAGLSCNDAKSHEKWLEDIAAYTKQKRGKEFKPAYPIFADTERKVAHSLGMINLDHVNAKGIPLPARKVFIVDPKKIIKLTLCYPAATGRNFDEILRVLDSLQLTSYKKLATPANWKVGDDCVLLPNVQGKEAETYKPQLVELPSGKEYLRIVKCPEQWPKKAIE